MGAVNFLTQDYVSPFLGNLFEANLLAKGALCDVRLVVVETMKANNSRIASVVAFVGLIQQTKADLALVVIIVIVIHFEKTYHLFYLSVGWSKPGI
jgi:hypothetical protein